VEWRARRHCGATRQIALRRICRSAESGSVIRTTEPVSIKVISSRIPRGNTAEPVSKFRYQNDSVRSNSTRRLARPARRDPHRGGTRSGVSSPNEPLNLVSGRIGPTRLRALVIPLSLIRLVRQSQLPCRWLGSFVHLPVFLWRQCPVGTAVFEHVRSINRGGDLPSV